MCSIERLFLSLYAECEVGSDQYSVPTTGASNDDSYDVLHKGPWNKHIHVCSVATG